MWASAPTVLSGFALGQIAFVPNAGTLPPCGVRASPTGGCGRGKAGCDPKPGPPLQLYKQIDSRAEDHADGGGQQDRGQGPFQASRLVPDRQDGGGAGPMKESKDGGAEGRGDLIIFIFSCELFIK